MGKNRKDKTHKIPSNCPNICPHSSYPNAADANPSNEQLFHLIQNYRQIHTPEKMYKVYAIDFKFREQDRELRKEVRKGRREMSVGGGVGRKGKLRF